MTSILFFVLLGLAAGFISGLIGIGGGVIIVPALVFLAGLTQHQAQGTTLALLVPPIGLFGAWTYYKQGYVDIRIALFICLGFLLGSLAGSQIAVNVPTGILKKLFGGAMLAIAAKMILD